MDAVAFVPCPFRRDGDWLINARHGCRIRLLGSINDKNRPECVQEVFRLQVAGHEVACVAVAPAAVRPMFDFRTGQEANHDEVFFVDKLAARFLVTKTVRGDTCDYLYLWFIETASAIYKFLVFTRTELPSSSVTTIRSVIETFRVEAAAAS